MKEYFIIKFDYINKQSEIITKDNKYNALEIIQQLAETYIYTVTGKTKPIYYAENKIIKNYGYYIEKSLNNVDKLTVKHKYIKKSENGFINIGIDSIISFYIASCESIYNNIDTYKRNLYENKIKFDMVIEDLRFKFM